MISVYLQAFDSSDGSGDLPKTNLSYLVAIIRNEFSFLQTGFVLSEKWILSQASGIFEETMKGKNPDEIKILTYGGFFKEPITENKNYISFLKDVKSVVIHWKFNPKYNEEYNIAFLELYKDSYLNKKFEPIKLGRFNGNLLSCFHIGYFRWIWKDQFEDFNRNSTHFYSLSYETFPMSYHSCNHELGLREILKPKQMCTATTFNEFTGYCSVGHGLICDNHIIGLLIWGPGCKGYITSKPKKWTVLSDFSNFFKFTTGFNFAKNISSSKRHDVVNKLQYDKQFIVAIIKNSNPVSFMCTGIIVSEKWTLTSATCVCEYGM